MIRSNDTALITGSSGGIGEEFAVELARRGDLVLVARRKDKLNALRSRLLTDFPHLAIDVLLADLSVAGSAADVVVQIEALGRHIAILINNAGVGMHGQFTTQKPDENAAQIQLNCTTLVELTGAFLPAMLTSSHGLVVNVASVAAFQPVPGMAVYGGLRKHSCSRSPRPCGRRRSHRPCGSWRCAPAPPKRSSTLARGKNFSPVAVRRRRKSSAQR